MVKAGYKFAFLFILLIAGGSTQVVFAQETTDDPYKDVVQFTGIIVSESDSTIGIPGVHIYVPKGGRGSTTNPYGYFSMPVLMGDSVVVSAVGFEKKSFIIPSDQGKSLSAVIELVEDTTYLREIAVFPYPTEELFKEAILALELPYEDNLNNLDEFLSQDVLNRMYWEMGPSASLNHRFFMDQQFRAQQYRFQAPANPLLNPFAWAQLIKSIKRGDYKRNKN